MCGIVGYVGYNHCKKFILDGLTNLEYRGYDSAGFVCIDEKHKHFSFLKKTGKVLDLRQALESVNYNGFVGLGHTRWATHGVVNENNAHPQFNCQKSVAVVHNGIIEGYEKIRQELIEAGHDFSSSTDTEVIAHLFTSLFSLRKNIKKTLIDLVDKLKGAYSFVLLREDATDELIIVRRRSPLVIGIGDDELFIASDTLAFAGKTNKVCFVPDDSFAVLKKDNIQLYNFAGQPLQINVQEIDIKINQVDKKGFEHFMLKEIYEQKKIIDNIVSFCRLIGSDFKLSSVKCNDTNLNYKINVEYRDGIWQQLGLSLNLVKKLKKINLVAAGTSWHACRIAQFFFEEICKLPTSVYLASEFCYMPFFKYEDSIFFFVSQSGETADTLQALRHVNSFAIPTIAITNVPSSSMVREANGFFPMQAGPEIAVASTKAFSAQLSILFLIANRIALERKIISDDDMRKAEEDLFIAAEVLEMSIENYKWKIIQKLAEKYSKFDRFLFLGRHISYPFSMEAALKLKEISYIFAQCYPAGELKHGPIALIDLKTPIVIFSVVNNLIYKKLVSNAQEVKARNGHLIVFAFEGQEELINLADFAFIIPKVNQCLAPLAMTGLMQFFVYQITKKLGCPIDKPRNLAKSVTVE